MIVVSSYDSEICHWSPLTDDGKNESMYIGQYSAFIPCLPILLAWLSRCLTFALNNTSIIYTYTHDSRKTTHKSAILSTVYWLRHTAAVVIEWKSVR